MYIYVIASFLDILLNVIGLVNDFSVHFIFLGNFLKGIINIV